MIKKTRIISVVNQKGGVGKTTTAVNLSGGLAKEGFKVCLIDMDHQGNATTSLGVDVEDKPTVAELLVLQDAKLEDVVVETEVKNLHLVPSDISLAKADKRLNTEGGKEYKLRNKVLEQKKNYDFIIIDCPPSLTNLFENSMTTCSEYIIPIQLDSFSVSGVGQMLEEVRKLEKDVFINVNHKSKLLGALITLHEKSTKISKSVGEDIEQIFKDKLFKTKIPKNTTIKDSQNNAKTIFDYSQDSAGAKAYKSLVKEVLER